MMRIVVEGYQHSRPAPRVNVLAVTPLAMTIQEIVKTESLYAYAARQPGMTTLHGRGPVYVITFGMMQIRVAVRHAMRGGWLAPLLKDRFLPPTRSFRELINSLQLRLAGVPTPEILALVTYPAGGPFRRADIMTRFIPESADLAAVFNDARNDMQRRPILDAVATLLTKLAKLGAQHADLNLKNILITADEQGYTAHLLDVDRVHFHAPNDPLVARANLDRLTHSFRRWRERPSVRRDALSDEDIAYLMLAVSAATP